jgi:hypothetical protein
MNDSKTDDNLPDTPASTQTAELSSASLGRRKKPFLVLGLLVVALVLWNASVAIPAMNALKTEEKLSVFVYRRWYISPDQIVFDVRSVDPDAAMIDADRALFLTAKSLKDREFTAVFLAARGEVRLLLDGDHFKTIGKEWETQNAIYTIRTLPEHVYNLDGQPAFGRWTGGLLGVLSKQMQDHNELHMRWWMRPIAGLQDPKERPPADYSEAP